MYSIGVTEETREMPDVPLTVIGKGEVISTGALPVAVISAVLEVSVFVTSVETTV